MERRGDVPCLIAQAIELFLAVHARDLIEILFDLGTRPALGCAAARAGRLQVLEQRARARGEMVRADGTRAPAEIVDGNAKLLN